MIKYLCKYFGSMGDSCIKISCHKLWVKSAEQDISKVTFRRDINIAAGTMTKSKIILRRQIRMKFNTLVLEGDKEAEKKAKEAQPPVSSKSEYLRRKRRESLPPLFNRSFYLCRMIEEELKGIDIDGSGKITICAHNVHMYPGEEKYICDSCFHISVYYLEQEQIEAIEKAADEGTESIVIAGILRNSLLDIARRNTRSDDVIQTIENAFERIIDSHFVREERIARLTKRSGSTGLTAHIYRVLSEEQGEGWYIKITDRKGSLLRQETIGGGTRYVNRLGSRLYTKAEWRGDTFVIMERFGKVVFSMSVQSKLN